MLVTGDWETMVVKAEVWVEAVTKGEGRVMAAGGQGEDGARNRQGKRGARRRGKLQSGRER